MRLIFLGAPGSGKGTQAEILSGKLGVPSISTGEMLRQAIAAGSELGRRVEAIMESGDLVDDETMAEIVENRLGQEDALNGFILDGYPRTRGQVQTLDVILDGMGCELDAVIHIEVPEEELIRRALARQRVDDRKEVIQQRLDVYRELTRPLIEHYERRGLLRVIDGFRTIDEVAGGILAALEVAV